MSDSSSVDYDAVLADLKSKRERLDAAIAGIESMLGIRGLATETPKKAEPEPEYGTSLGPGAFLGMTIVDATKKYLGHKRQSQRTEDILRALTDGGIVLTSQEPLNTVGSVLNRNFGAGGDIVRVSRGVWGLAEWHPRLRKKRASVPNGDELLDEMTAGTKPEGTEPGASDDDPLA